MTLLSMSEIGHSSNWLVVCNNGKLFTQTYRPRCREATSHWPIPTPYRMKILHSTRLLAILETGLKDRSPAWTHPKCLLSIARNAESDFVVSLRQE